MDEQQISTEVVEKERPQTPMVVGENGAMLSQAFIDCAEKQVELRLRLLHTALKALKPHDIQDFDGKPYLEGEGAARIMAVIRGFKVGEAKFSIETIHPHFFIECNIPMEFYGATTVAIGDCSTADPFFTGRDGASGQYKRHLDRTGSEAMAARLILGDAKKKARENALSRGVSELMGIKGLSWEDLEKLGFSRSGAGAKVNYKKGSSGGEVKNLSVSEASSVAIGSVVNISGAYASHEVRTVTAKGEEKKITGYKITDGNATITVQVWKADEIDPSLGVDLFCSKVKITEYQGKRQYTAEAVDPIIEGAGNDNSGE